MQIRGFLLLTPFSLTCLSALSYHRYYQLKASYFMSGLGASMLEVMSKNALWVRILGSSSIMEPDNRVRFADRIKKATDRLQNVDATSLAASSVGSGSSGAAAPGLMGMLAGGRGGPGGASSGGGSSRRRRDGGAGAGASELTKGAQACCEIAIETCKGHSSQIIKDILFNALKRQEAKMQAIHAESMLAGGNAMQTDP
jgi:hypothetical protein